MENSNESKNLKAIEEILSTKTPEEIEKLAMDAINHEEHRYEFKEIERLKILKLDKNAKYSEEGSQMIRYAIGNALVLLLVAFIITHYDINIASFDTNTFSNLYSEIVNKIPFLSSDNNMNHAYNIIYSLLYNGVNQIISKIGLLGFILAGRATSLVIELFRGTIKELKIKKDIKEIDERINEFEKRVKL